MIPQFCVLKTVPELVFSAGAISRVPHIRASRRLTEKPAVFIIDHFFQDGRLDDSLQPRDFDYIFYLDTTDEPTTIVVDAICQKIKLSPEMIVGIGGGSTMDVAKAISILLTNSGSAENYQGWDLPSNPGIFKVGVPTISGTGAEVSRTAVLTGPRKKQGINSIFSLFDSILLDPDLLVTVPDKQRLFTGMDCYIHCVESLSGSFLNEFSAAFAGKALDLCRYVFLNDGSNADLMVASYMGGHAVVYSEVGLVHALSYGLSWAFHIHHGEANCIIFNELNDYYSPYLPEFRRMLDKANMHLGLPKDLSFDNQLISDMADIVLLMERPLHNALGANWRDELPKSKIMDFYFRLLERT